MKSGRESTPENDLFFVCSVIEYIGRITKNSRGDVVTKLGETEITRILELADVFHCEPIEATADELIERSGLNNGNFDNVAICKYIVPTHFDIAKVYKRLIFAISNANDISLVSALTEVYTSWISEKIDDYNSSMYYESPQYLYACYISGEVLE